MKARLFHAPSAEDILDTLAQSGTKKSANTRQKRTITVQGEGTEVLTNEKKLNRAKKKMITQKLMLSLMDVATKKGELERTKGYRNAYYCQSEVISSGDKFYGKYCKNRFCIVCSNIRKAKIINQYISVIQQWPDAHFVTLTAKSVPANRLKDRFRRMKLSMKKILSYNKTKALRGKEVKLIGIRSLECNFNPKRRTYNPHFHIIVATGEMADIFIKEWLDRCTPSYASPKAQSARKVENTEHDLIEVVKYGTKIFTDPEMSKKQKNKTKVTPKVYVSAFDQIVSAMEGHRLFERFGFNLPKSEKVKESKSTRLAEYQTLIYDTVINDWIDAETRVLITGYKPSATLTEIFEKYWDVNLM